MSDGFNIYGISALVSVTDKLAGDAKAIETILKGKGYRFEIVQSGYTYRVEDVIVSTSHNRAVEMFRSCLQSQFPMEYISIPMYDRKDYGAHRKSTGSKIIDKTMPNQLANVECVEIAPYSDEAFDKASEQTAREWISMKLNSKKAKSLATVSAWPSSTRR